MEAGTRANVAIKIAVSTSNGNPLPQRDARRRGGGEEEREIRALEGHKGKCLMTGVARKPPGQFLAPNIISVSRYCSQRAAESRASFRHGIRGASGRSAFPRCQPLSRNNGDIISRVCVSSNDHLYSCALIRTGRISAATARRYEASCCGRHVRPTRTRVIREQIAVFRRPSTRRRRELEMGTGREVKDK